jgi:hypothetical protein
MAMGDRVRHLRASKLPEENAMNTLPLHPAVVHVPLGLALIMPVLLAALVWAIVTGRLPVRAWLVGVLLQGVILGAAVVALGTGEQDEKRVEGRVGEAQVEAHERAARAFTFAAGGAFVAAALGLALRNRHRLFLAAGLGTVALSLAMLGFGIQAGHRGGLLVHGRGDPNAPGRGEPGGGEAQAVGQDAPDQDDDGDDD